MYDRAIVLELKEKYALALKEGGGIIRIRRKDGLAVGSQVYVLPEDLYVQARARAVLPIPFPQGTQKALRRVTGVAAILLLCISLFLLPQVTYSASAVVSFDAENGIQLELDQNSTILRAISVDGKIPQAALDALKGRKLSDVGQTLALLLGDGAVLIGYAPENDPLDEVGLRRDLDRIFTGRKSLFLAGGAADVTSAANSHLSLGSYLAGKLVVSDREADALEELSLEELQKLLHDNPKWMGVPAFQEALDDKQDDRPDDDEPDADAPPDAAEPPDEDDPPGTANRPTAGRPPDADDESAEDAEDTEDDQDAAEVPSDTAPPPPDTEPEDPSTPPETEDPDPADPADSDEPDEPADSDEPAEPEDPPDADDPDAAD